MIYYKSRQLAKTRTNKMRMMTSYIRKFFAPPPGRFLHQYGGENGSGSIASSTPVTMQLISRVCRYSSSGPGCQSGRASVKSRCSAACASRLKRSCRHWSLSPMWYPLPGTSGPPLEGPPLEAPLLVSRISTSVEQGADSGDSAAWAR